MQSPLIALLPGKIFPRKETVWFLPRQAGSHLARDSTTSQAVSAVSPNSPPSQENISQEGNSLVSSQAGRQVPTLLGTALLPRKLVTPLLLGKVLPRQAITPQREAGRQLGAQLGSGPPRLPKGIVLLLRQVVLAPGKAPLPPNKLLQWSSSEEPYPKWVINLSSKPLTQAQRCVLAKGPNFAVSPKHPPNLGYITAIDMACTKLSQQDPEELRADINRVLRSSHPQTQFN